MISDGDLDIKKFNRDWKIFDWIFWIFFIFAIPSLIYTCVQEKKEVREEKTEVKNQ